eukprot:Transcript_6755.p2 GENE.Transcript_6755~~Transcript_6755.p2  ORF type:complete len:152 (-),score=53.32 Transcript_6755:214-669(-)
MPQRGVQMGQDWSTVTFSSRPTSAAASSAQKQQGLKEAQRSGAAIETSAKFGGGGNKQATAASAKARQLEEMTDVGEVQKVPTELKVAIQKGRAAKGLTQKQLATQLNMQPQVIQGYENGKEVPNNAVIAKIEKALGCKLPRMPKKKPGAE